MTDVDEIYRRVQVLDLPEEPADPRQLAEHADAWKDPSIPALQAQVSDHQVERFRQGLVDPVFASLIRVLQRLTLDDRSFLDAACATGYYSEIVATTCPGVRYRGSDYSEAMIEEARRRYPERDFRVEDATRMSFDDRSFHCVMLSGALEHIPDYETAIGEICRVAAGHVIVHRLPVTRAGRAQHTLGSQYSIKTPRTYFPLKTIVRSFRQRGLRLAANVPTYDLGRIVELKKKLRRAERDTRTLLFSR